MNEPSRLISWHWRLATVKAEMFLKCQVDVDEVLVTGAVSRDFFGRVCHETRTKHGIRARSLCCSQRHQAWLPATSTSAESLQKRKHGMPWNKD
jgi:hypothetical protein